MEEFDLCDSALHTAYTEFARSKKQGMWRKGSLNRKTCYVPVSCLQTDQEGRVWLGRGWWCSKRPRGPLQARVTCVDGELSVGIRYEDRFKLGFKYLELDEPVKMSKVNNFFFVEEW